MKWFSLVDSLCGLRGKLIGEASHPGPASQGSSIVPALPEVSRLSIWK